MIFNYHEKFLEKIVKDWLRTMLGIAIISVIVVWTYRDFLPTPFLLLWGAAQVLFILLRHLNTKKIADCLKRGAIQKANQQTKILLGLMVYSAFLWNTILIVGSSNAPSTYEFFSFVVVLGLITAAIMSLSPVIHIYYIYFCCMLLPQLIFIMQFEGESHLSVLLLSLVFVPYILTFSRSINSNLLTTVRASERLLSSVDELHQRSVTDPLTKLYNRRYFFAAAQSLIELAQREQKQASLLMLDIDHFKKINDSYGHQTGDYILVSFAAEIQAMVRRDDIFARIGGEEFSLLLYNVSEENARIIAEKICQTIGKKSFKYRDSTLSATVSIGIASLNEENTSLEDLFGLADANLYKAKENGRNRYIS